MSEREREREKERSREDLQRCVLMHTVYDVGREW